MYTFLHVSGAERFKSIQVSESVHDAPVVGHHFSEFLMSSISPFSNITDQEKESYLNRGDYEKVRTQGYEKGLLTPAGMVAHAMNSIFVGREVDAFRGENAYLSEKEFQVVLEDKLSAILLGGVDSKKIDLSYYKPLDGTKRGYGKYLLYSNPDQSNPFCVQLFVFAAGQKTRLHNHIAPCSTTVLQGAVEEKLFEPQSGQRKGEPLAHFVSSTIRQKGSLGGFDDGKLNDVHQIRHLGSEGYAITAHYYKDLDGVEFEKPEATQLRKTSFDLIGKTNAAELFRKVKSEKGKS